MKKVRLQQIREERHKKWLKRQKAEKKKQKQKQKKAPNHSYPCSLQIPFEFKPSLVFTQPYSWILYDIFKKPLHQRIQLLTQITGGERIFPTFCNAVYQEYIVEARLRYQFKRLLNAWLQKKMDRKSSDLVDIVTMNPIRHPIYVYDGKQRRRYIFEADSLNKSMKRNLYAQQYTIPGPKKPVNIITNKPFTYVQLVSIYDQLLNTRIRMEDISIFRKFQFRLETWKLYMYNHLYMAAIKDELYNVQSMDGKDMLEDFIKDMITILKVPLSERFELMVTNAVSWYPEDPLLQQCRALCLSSYEATTFQLNIGPLLTHRFQTLFLPTYPNGPLWTQVWNRMVADSEAEQALEAEDVAMGR
jgi:hypothetical protein